MISRIFWVWSCFIVIFHTVYLKNVDLTEKVITMLCSVEKVARIANIFQLSSIKNDKHQNSIALKRGIRIIRGPLRTADIRGPNILINFFLIEIRILRWPFWASFYWKQLFHEIFDQVWNSHISLLSATHNMERWEIHCHIFFVKLIYSEKVHFTEFLRRNVSSLHCTVLQWLLKKNHFYLGRF